MRQMMWPKCCVSIVHRGTTTFHTYKSFQRSSIFRTSYAYRHGLRTPREEIAFTARPKIQSQSQIFRYGGSIFCLPHRPNFSDIFDLCLHWVSVVRAYRARKLAGRGRHICEYIMIFSQILAIAASVANVMNEDDAAKALCT